MPAGFNRVVYEPRFAHRRPDVVRTVANEDAPTQMAHPMPVGLSFWAGPGEEPAVLRAAAAMQAVTRHQAAPPAFRARCARRRAPSERRGA
ncbi:MAG: hypothetical protein R2712_22195 [Vicinamibacterales bacterium]